MRRGVRGQDPVAVDSVWIGGAAALLVARLHGDGGAWLFSASYLLPPVQELTDVHGHDVLRREPGVRRSLRLKPGEFAVRRRSPEGVWHFADFHSDEDLPRRVMYEVRQIL